MGGYRGTYMAYSVIGMAFIFINRTIYKGDGKMIHEFILREIKALANNDADRLYSGISLNN